MPNLYPEMAEGNDAEADVVASDPRSITPRVSAPATTEDYSLNRYAPMASRRKSLPDLTVENAYKTLQFFQDNPRYLANPYTRHAAESVFGAASKVIGTSIQLEGINARVEATKARNGLALDVGRNLLKMQMKGGAAAEVAAKWNAIGENGQPLWQNSSNWQAIMRDSKSLEETEKPLGPIGKNLHDELAFYRQGGTKSQWDEAVKENERRGLAPADVQLLNFAQQYRDDGDVKHADMLEAIVTERGRAKGGAQNIDRNVTITETDLDGNKVTRRLTDAEAAALAASKPIKHDAETAKQLTDYAEEKAALAAGDKSIGPDWLGLSDRARKLGELKIKLEQKGVNPDTGTRLSVSAATNSPAAVAPNVTQQEYESLKSGDLYWWNGKQIPKR